MTLTRRLRETQISFVARVLIEQGRVDVYDLLYASAYEDGRKTSVTRSASVIWTLRHEFGWSIDTAEHQGAVASYVLRARPEAKVAHIAPRAVPAPRSWQAGWSCMSCGQRPQSEPQERLAGMAEAVCEGCRQRRYFRRAAA